MVLYHRLVNEPGRSHAQQAANPVPAQGPIGTTHALKIVPISPKDRDAAAIIRAWRALTGGRKVRDHARRTLVGCSGGADSCALAITLAAATDRLVIAHVVHDLRPRAEALVDRDAAAALAAALSLPFVEQEVRVRSAGGNAEASARTLRYRALAELARRHDCPFVAVAHHADDQLETLLMRLIRGSGPRGLSAVRPKRVLGENGPLLVRPMLGVTRADARAICARAGWTWNHDASNDDLSRLRAAVRAGPAALLCGLAPGAAPRAAQSAELIAQAAAVVGDAATELLNASMSSEPSDPSSTNQPHTRDTRTAAPPSPSHAWNRDHWRSARPIVTGEALRRVITAGDPGSRGLDRLAARTLAPVVAAIRDTRTDPRTFRLGPATVRLTHDRIIVIMADAGMP
jgi:tRNA(Ile)-lysidine synthase